jgi:hypothetical protein
VLNEACLPDFVMWRRHLSRDKHATIPDDSDLIGRISSNCSFGSSYGKVQSYDFTIHSRLIVVTDERLSSLAQSKNIQETASYREWVPLCLHPDHPVQGSSRAPGPPEPSTPSSSKADADARGHILKLRRKKKDAENKTNGKTLFFSQR